MADGTGLRPVYKESELEWVTHESVISKDEVAFAIMGHRQIPGSTKTVPAGTTVGGVNTGLGTVGDARKADRFGHRQLKNARNDASRANAGGQRTLACVGFVGWSATISSATFI